MVEGKLLIVDVRGRVQPEASGSIQSRESSKLNMASRVNWPWSGAESERGREEREKRREGQGGDQDPQEHMAQMAGSVGIRSWGQEAHELEEFRVGHGMRRAERSQVPAWPVMGACCTVERTWRPGHSLLG